MESYFTDFATASFGSRPRGGRDDQPLIGLSVNVDGETSRLHHAYVQSVLDAGGTPLLIPATTDADALRRAVECIDGLILTGGSDVGGRYFGEETLEGFTDVNPLRDAYDFLLLRLAADRQLPVFGICRGLQVINIAFGGTLWQDVPSQYPSTPLEHSILVPREKPAHPVSVAEGSVLASVFAKSRIEVNSRHHQAIKEVAEGFRATAIAPDGIVEAIEAYPLKRIMGVQWHPENLAAEGDDEDMKALFRFFAAEAALFRKAKDIHRRHLTVDSHCDTPMLFARRTVDMGRRDPVAKLDFAKMAEGKTDAAFVAAYLPQGPRDAASCEQATRKAVSLLEEVKRQIAENAAYAGQAAAFADADTLKREGRRAVFLSVENGYAIGRDLRNIGMFRDMGVAYITLCHNGANDLCDSAAGDPEHGGLSPLGREAVREMNRLGVAVDLSHAAPTTFCDVLRESGAPVICSHSSARALCDHPRNLTDDQIRALAAAGGVIQICLYGPFLATGREATLMDAVDHIDYVVRLAGVDHVGIGSDFDGDGGIAGCNNASEFINITVELLRRGYTGEQSGKILGGNLRRVMDAVQAAACEQ